MHCMDVLKTQSLPSRAYRIKSDLFIIKMLIQIFIGICLK